MKLDVCLLSLVLLCVSANGFPRAAIDDDAPWIWDYPASQRTRMIQEPKTTQPTTTQRPTTVSPNTPTTRVVTIATPRSCPGCPMTSEYNPICGTDRITYNNPGVLRCAKLCGAEVDVLFNGPCAPSIVSILQITGSPNN